MNFYDINVVSIDGKPKKMDVYRGKTLLIVNLRASACKGKRCQDNLCVS
jgi:glutathione peroxidase